jgi:hypothetical protein
MDWRERAVLAFCNRVRKQFGKKPRKTIAKGVRGRSDECPVAMTIGTLPFDDGKKVPRVLPFTGVKVPTKRSVNSYIELPDTVQQFVWAFDSGRGYEQYRSDK